MQGLGGEGITWRAFRTTTCLYDFVGFTSCDILSLELQPRGLLCRVLWIWPVGGIRIMGEWDQDYG